MAVLGSNSLFFFVFFFFFFFFNLNKEKEIGSDDVLIVAGDTLFYHDFQLSAFLDANRGRKHLFLTSYSSSFPHF